MAALLEPYQPLYLKHRPQALGQLVGQRTVVKTLTNAIDNDRLAHAYLFTGPRGCGKTSSARILAKSLNCEKGPTATPCLECTMCEEIKKGISPAVMEIDAASNNSVDDARILIERAPLVAQGGRFKLYIIDECHMLTKEAFNALLKTIEEPPPKVVFILATTEEHKVPPTIVSRCQRLMFKLVNHEELSAHLRNVADQEKIAIEDEAIQLIARRSGGGLRDALGLLDQASLLATPEKPVGIKDLLVLLGAIEEDVLLTISEGIADRDAERVLSSAHQLLAQGREPSLVTLELAKHFLNLAKGMHLSQTKAASTQGEPQDTSLAQQLIMGSADYIQKVIALSNRFEGSELTQIVTELDRLEQTLRRSTQPSLALEVGLLSLCHRHDIVLFRELAKKVEYLESAIAGGVIPAAASTHTPSGHAQSGHAQSGHAQSGHAQSGHAQSAHPSHAGPPPAAQQFSPPAQHLPAQTQSAPVQQPAPAARAPEPAKASPPSDTRPATTATQEPGESRVQEEAATPAGSTYQEPPASNGADEERAAPPQPARSAPADEFAVNDDGDVEPVASTDEPEPEEAEPPPRPAAPAPSAGSSSGSMDMGRGVDLDEFWSNLMADLQSRHLPSYAMVSQFAFPLSVHQEELVIGVLKENLQKMVEAKAEQIKTSAKAVCGRELFIKVRVAEGNPAPKSAGRPRETGASTANRGQPQERASSPAPSAVGHADDDESEPVPAAQASALRASSSAVSNTAEKANPRPAVESSRLSSADLTRMDHNNGGESADQLMVKEAYKLFEGPGSRRVG